MSVDELVNRAVSKSADKPRILITLGGIPGAGKSTIGAQVTEKLNERGIPTVLVGMDGYHYTREELTARIGHERAVKYRGAPYTFDAEGVVLLAHDLATPNLEVRFPTFDHAIKDPVPNAGIVSADTRIVILEGNYVQLNDEVWRDIDKFAADTWFVDVDFDVARERLAKRHVASGIAPDLEAGKERADSNDLVNGRYIIEHSKAPAYKLSN